MKFLNVLPTDSGHQKVFSKKSKWPEINFLHTSIDKLGTTPSIEDFYLEECFANNSMCWNYE